MTIDPQNIHVRLAKTPEEILEAQALRYKVFYEENGAQADEQTRNSKLDRDVFDDYADHVIVVHTPDDGEEKIVGTYRMLSGAQAQKIGRFYTDSEYDITLIKNADENLLEFGRSCVLKEFRTRPVMQLLWQGIADYISDHDVTLMFGCASFSGTDIEEHKQSLAYLHHFHGAPDDICPVALSDQYVDMNLIPKDKLDVKRAFAALPPLMKGYLRLGATIGNGAIIDKQFNTIDVCIIVQTYTVSDRYRKHYERKIQKSIPSRTEQAGVDA